jgi:hypothetical protein
LKWLAYNIAELGINDISGMLREPQIAAGSTDESRIRR